MTTLARSIHLPLTPTIHPPWNVPDEARALLALADEQMDRARTAVRKAETLRRAAALITTQANRV